MKARFPIAYWGSVSYYKALVSARNVVFEVEETYRKQSCRNRCSILTASGVLDLSIPVIKPNGSKSLSKEVLISNDEDWRKTHWRAIKSAYASSPYFEHYATEIYVLIYNECDNLSDFVLAIHDQVSRWFELPIATERSEEFALEYEHDFLTAFKRRSGEGSEFYQQVFTDKKTFEGDLSILDAVLNLGPMARELLVK